MTIRFIMKSIWFVASILLSILAFLTMFNDCSYAPVFFDLGMCAYFGGCVFFLGSNLRGRKNEH